MNPTSLWLLSKAAVGGGEGGGGQPGLRAAVNQEGGEGGGQVWRGGGQGVGGGGVRPAHSLLP